MLNWLKNQTKKKREKSEKTAVAMCLEMGRKDNFESVKDGYIQRTEILWRKQTCWMHSKLRNLNAYHQSSVKKVSHFLDKICISQM